MGDVRAEIKAVMDRLEKYRASRRTYIVLTDEEITAIKMRVPVQPDGLWWFDTQTVVEKFYGLQVLRASDVIVSEAATREATER